MSAMVEVLLVLALAQGAAPPAGPALRSATPEAREGGAVLRSALPDQREGGIDPYDEPAADLEKRLGDGNADRAEAPERKAKQQEDESENRPGLRSALEQEDAPFLDFGWLEFHPRIGLAVFSDDYQIDPSPAFAVELRAPLPFLAPPSNEHGDYFGLFAEIALTVAERTLEPELDQASGAIMLFTFGLDFTLWRTPSWMMLLRGGYQYAMYGGITDLRDGWGPMAGFSLGFSLTRSVYLTVAPEVSFGRGGDYIAFGLFGLSIGF